MMNFCLGFMPIVRVFSLFFHVSSVIYFWSMFKFPFHEIQVSSFYLHSVLVPVVPGVQFGSYIQVHVSKGWPHLLGFTGKC
jgi:hypothetical protein